jgi:hypothetical protein
MVNSNFPTVKNTRPELSGASAPGAGFDARLTEAGRRDNLAPLIISSAKVELPPFLGGGKPQEI